MNNCKLILAAVLILIGLVAIACGQTQTITLHSAGCGSVLTNFQLTTKVMTNVTETPTDFERFEPIDCPEGRLGCLVYHSRGVNPQGKIITTTVKEVQTLTFGWEGAPQTVTKERVLRESQEHLRKEWQHVKAVMALAVTNLMQTKDLISTNAAR